MQISPLFPRGISCRQIWMKGLGSNWMTPERGRRMLNWPILPRDSSISIRNLYQTKHLCIYACNWPNTNQDNINSRKWARNSGDRPFIKEILRLYAINIPQTCWCIHLRPKLKRFKILPLWFLYRLEKVAKSTEINVKEWSKVVNATKKISSFRPSSVHLHHHSVGYYCPIMSDVFLAMFIDHLLRRPSRLLQSRCISEQWSPKQCSS